MYRIYCNTPHFQIFITHYRDGRGKKRAILGGDYTHVRYLSIASYSLFTVSHDSICINRLLDTTGRLHIHCFSSTQIDEGCMF